MDHGAQLLQQIINGLVSGSVYALVALGYTMVYGILGLINFAHGEVLMVGAFVALQAMLIVQQLWPEIPPLAMLGVGLIVATPACMLVGYTIERLAYRPLRNAPRLAPLITAIGVSFLLQTLAMMIWGRSPLSFPQLITATPIALTAHASITAVQIVIMLVSAALMVGLLLLVHRTSLGRAMRATAENHRVAALMGVNVNRIISLTFLLGSALAAVAGIAVASYYGNIKHDMGFLLGLKAFSAAVLGGIGNLGGAVLGGLLLGLVESIGAGYLSEISFGFLDSSYQDVFTFLILIIVLIFRPTGLLGERVTDRA